MKRFQVQGYCQGLKISLDCSIDFTDYCIQYFLSLINIHDFNVDALIIYMSSREPKSPTLKNNLFILSVLQMENLTKLLPPGYSLQLKEEHESHQSISPSQGKHVDDAEINQKGELNKFSICLKEIRMIDSSDRSPSEEFCGSPKLLTPPQRQVKSGVGKSDEMKVLSLLKHWKHSEMFLQPINFEKIEKEKYFQTTEKPMDLFTVEEKLKGGKYACFQEFQADIFLMIENSYTLNKKDEKLLKFTAEFEAYFNQISEEIEYKIHRNKKRDRKRKSQLNSVSKPKQQQKKEVPTEKNFRNSGHSSKQNEQKSNLLSGEQIQNLEEFPQILQKKAILQTKDRRSRAEKISRNRDSGQTNMKVPPSPFEILYS